MSVIWSGVTEEGAVVPVQVTDEGKVVAVGDGPQGDYLPTSGGNLTGDLTLGTDKIKLDAADGSAVFAGGNTEVLSDGALRVKRSAANGSLGLAIYPDNDFTKPATAVISTDGSAEFAGDVSVGAFDRQSSTAAGAELTSAGCYVQVPKGTVNYQEMFSVTRGKLVSAGGDPADEGLRAAIFANGNAEFAGDITVGDSIDGTFLGAGDGTVIRRSISPGSSNAFFACISTHNGANDEKVKFGTDGSAIFKGDVVIGSRGDTWLIRESNGVAMLVQQSREASPMSGVSPMIPEQVRDIPSELDLIEMALNEVMEKLRMTPPAGWPVWDGSDNP